MSPAIRVSGLGKQYRLGLTHAKSLNELASRWTARLRGRRSDPPAAADDGESREFWALRDVSFEVQPGEVVGIIGRNGAGKSTLLKILSRITRPTTGRVEINGRVGSLLEVGTGFHHELTGRENVYMNGTLLGMTRREVARKLDEIVDFAGVDRFLDTPVKRYSSGMKVRLAFAVAAHLEPEILIVDEVLAVGDAALQRKCLGKMQDVAEHGRTVLFVSHNMSAVRSLCHRGLLLDSGRLTHDTCVEEIIEIYVDEQFNENSRFRRSDVPDRPHIWEAVLRQRGEVTSIVRIDEPFSLEVEVDPVDESELALGVMVTNQRGICVGHFSDEFSSAWHSTNARIRTCIFPAYAFAVGGHSLSLSLSKRNYEMYESIEDALGFHIEFTGPLSDRTEGTMWKGTCGPGLAQWAT